MKTWIVFLALITMSQTANASLIASRLTLLNFREILYTYSALTDVSANDPEIVNTFRFARDRLPLNGDVEELSSPMIMAATELAGAFCSKFVAQESNREPIERVLLASVDFSRGLNQFSDTERTRLLEDMSAHFWQRLPEPQELAAIDEVFRNSIGEPQRGNSSALASGLLTTCTLLGTSLETLAR